MRLLEESRGNVTGNGKAEKTGKEESYLRALWANKPFETFIVKRKESH